MAAGQTKAAVGFASRIFVCGLGIATIAWGGYAFPVFWRQSGIEQTAAHIIAGDPYKANVLSALAPQLDAIEVDSWGRTSALRNSAVIRLRILENAIADGDQNLVDRQMIKLHEAIDESLANTPADPFLWFVLFWLENTQNGYSADHLKYLRMSYSLGPNEGWIGVKRNRFALAIFSQLPADLAENAKGEFVRLVDSRFFSVMADILVGPGWEIRGILLTGLKDAAEVNRELFAKTVYKLGYDISVPGVERPDQRPWH